MTDHDETLREIRDDLKLIRHWITGNGDPEKGLIVRVDRLEQTENRRKWLVGVAVTSAVGASIASIKALFGGTP